MKNIFLICFFALLVSSEITAQGSFYDINTIQRIEITFVQSNWDYMLDTATAGSEGFIMASKIKINGIEFDSVGVKYKGNSSYNASQVKNPFHIELDTYKDQNYQGYTDIKLGNGFKDPSFLREVLSYKIVRNYMPGPQSNFTNVYVNNKLIGLFSNSESVSKKFVNSHFGSKSNSFIKCNPISGAGPGSSQYPNLVYLGTDSALYYSRYELQSDHGWHDLINLCDTLANHPSAIESTLTVNQALWMMAFDNVLVNLDSYIGAFSQNYYLYKDDYSLFRPVVWDLNESFGTFAQTGTSNLNSTTSKQQMSHLLHATDDGWPLVKKLLAVPMYKRMYIAHMRTILAENIANNSYYTDGLALQNLISADVNSDPNKLFTYANFLSNLTTDVNIGMGVASGISNLMNGRNTYLKALPDFIATPPTISAITVSDNQPLLGSSVFVTANVTNTTISGVFIASRSNEYAPFDRIMMLDDGLHGDGSANDGIFGATLKINSGKTQYYLYAENSLAGAFSPVRAEQEFYTILTKASVGAKLVINEFLASNVSTMADQDGEFDDWIEIYNHSTETVSLDSVYLSDTYSNLLKWKFPNGTVILPKSYQVVWADDDNLQTGLHASFKLSAAGEVIALSHATTGVMDSVTFGLQNIDVSMQRCPNDSGSFIYSDPSFGIANNCPNGIVEESGNNQFTVYPNPFTDRLYIAGDTKAINNIRIINMTGQTLFYTEGESENSFMLITERFPKGLYMIIVNDVVSRKIIKN